MKRTIAAVALVLLTAGCGGSAAYDPGVAREWSKSMHACANASLERVEGCYAAAYERADLATRSPG